MPGDGIEILELSTIKQGWFGAQTLNEPYRADVTREPQLEKFYYLFLLCNPTRQSNLLQGIVLLHLSTHSAKLAMTASFLLAKQTHLPSYQPVPQAHGHQLGEQLI